jgi:hypothetical protein
VKPLADVAVDRRAPRFALPVLVLLHYTDTVFVDWRPVKQIAMAKELGCSQPAIVTALRYLVERQHLQRRNDPFAGALYRLRDG